MLTVLLSVIVRRHHHISSSEIVRITSNRLRRLLFLILTGSEVHVRCYRTGRCHTSVPSVAAIVQASVGLIPIAIT